MNNFHAFGQDSIPFCRDDKPMLLISCKDNILELCFKLLVSLRRETRFVVYKYNLFFETFKFHKKLFFILEEITYTFLITTDVPRGRPFGRIESPEYKCNAIFECLFSSKYLTVDRFKGTLTLLKNPFLLPKRYDGIHKLDQPLKIRVSCRSYRRNTIFIITVNLFAFPPKFGDDFLTIYNSYTLDKMVKANKLIYREEERSSQLHRMMRMVSKNENPEAHEEMMGSVKVKKALEGAINKIERVISKDRGNIVNSYFLYIDQVVCATIY